MFTVSCKNDCIEVHCVKFCTTVIPSVFVNGNSQIEVGPELECQLKLLLFLVLFFTISVLRDCLSFGFFFVLHILPFV